jgi:radical SAM/Cys-rich protein
MMAWPVMEDVLKVAAAVKPALVDITGGAPELNPDLRRLIEALTSASHPVQVRTNLTALLEPGMEDLPGFFKKHRVHLVGSMPCYMEENVCAQRGEGIYDRSVAAMKKLNKAGYGIDPELQLSLVYNPGGPFLPPCQTELEEEFRQELGNRFGIRFTDLIAIANMPIGRFRDALERSGELADYVNLLKDSFNPDTLKSLMCRHQVNISWDGTLYDCDFNLALGLSVDHGAPDRVEEFDPAGHASRRIVTGEHCFGCTAGAGSSCGGALL